MDPLQVHLALNHFPIIGTILCFVVLLYGLIKSEEAVTRVALVIFVVLAVISIPVHNSGEEAEHDVEEIVGVSEHFLEEHEDMGHWAYWLMLGTGVLALATLLGPRIKINNTKALAMVTLLAAAVTAGTMIYVGSLGGKIRRPDLRGETVEHHEHEHGHDHDTPGHE